MGTMTLIVDRKGSHLELAPHNVLKLGFADGSEQRVGLGALGCIVAYGKQAFSTPLLRQCAEHQIGIVLFPGRSKGEPAWLVDSPRGTRLRLAQYRCFLDPDCRLRLAREMVTRKISGQARWLDAHGKPALLDRFIDKAAQAHDIPELMGVEGAAAARYFHHWGVLWDPAWAFNGRNRRPPRDPINALLSLSYTLAASYVGRLPALRGLDGSLGFLHGPERDRPALRLDMLEPLRPWVDQWVWLQLQEGLLEPTDFYTTDAGGCRLNEHGRKAYFATWFRDEDAWLRREARSALAVVLAQLRPLM